MNICPPASVCVCVWLPAHPNVWTSWRAASRTAARSSWADCIIGGKAATLTWAYNGIVVRQGSRFLGLPKAITHSFFLIHPYLTFPRTKKISSNFDWLEKALISKIWKTCTWLFDPEMRGVFNLRSRHTSFWVDATLTLECERHGIYQCLSLVQNYQCLSLVQKNEAQIFINTCHFFTGTQHFWHCPTALDLPRISAIFWEISANFGKILQF